jgi:hypothetical protein
MGFQLPLEARARTVIVPAGAEEVQGEDGLRRLFALR